MDSLRCRLSNFLFVYHFLFVHFLFIEAASFFLISSYKRKASGAGSATAASPGGYLSEDSLDTQLN
jgi:hypothetical protein